LCRGCLNSLTCLSGNNTSHHETFFLNRIFQNFFDVHSLHLKTILPQEPAFVKGRDQFFWRAWTSMIAPLRWVAVSCLLLYHAPSSLSTPKMKKPQDFSRGCFDSTGKQPGVAAYPMVLWGSSVL
jgi:hypothetical protein